MEAAAGRLHDPVRPLRASTTRCRWRSGCWSRAGALLALAMAFRLARDSPAGASRRARGLVAALALRRRTGSSSAAHGSEAPFAVALMLWAIERHLDGRRDHAFVLGVLACLLRPSWSRSSASTRSGCGAEPRLRLLVVGALVSAVAGSCPSGSARATRRRREAGQRGAGDLEPVAAQDRPWLRARSTRAHNHAGLPSSSCWPLRPSVRVARLAPRRRLPPAGCLLAAAAVARSGAVRRHDAGGLLGQPALRAAGARLAVVLAGVGAACVLAAAGGLTARRRPALGAAARRCGARDRAPCVARTSGERMERELRQMACAWTCTATSLSALARARAVPRRGDAVGACDGEPRPTRATWPGSSSVPIERGRGPSAHRLVFARGAAQRRPRRTRPAARGSAGLSCRRGGRPAVAARWRVRCRVYSKFAGNFT